MSEDRTTSANHGSGEPGPQSARLTPTLVTSAVVAALGGLLFGFDTAVISGTTEALEEVFDLGGEWLGLPGSFWLGFTVASALIGTMVGAFLVGKPSDRFGRRNMLIGLAVLYFVSALGSALAWDWCSFLLFRFIGGLAVGGASVASPMYIAEISPAKFRGRLVAVAQLNIVVGILAAFFSNYLISRMGLGESQWRWMYGVETVPAAAFFLLLFSTPRSPRWLMTQNRVEEARSVLARLGAGVEDVEEAIRNIAASLDLAHHGVKEPLFRKAYLKPILLAVVIAAFNQLSGINALIYYAPTIFAMAGEGTDTALLQAVGIGVTNLIFTLIALAVIDHFGRKKLMIVGSIGYILSLGATAWAFYSYAEDFSASLRATASKEAASQTAVMVTAMHRDDSAALAAARTAAEKAAAAAKKDNAQSAAAAVFDAVKAVELSDAVAADEALDRARSAAKDANAAVDKGRLATGSTVVLVSMLVFIASHAVGQGAVIWVFISEIFPTRIRARGQALSSFTLWLMNASISWTFPVLAGISGGHTFAFFTVMMVLQLVWVLLVMPETKGVPLEEIQKKLGIE